MHSIEPGLWLVATPIGNLDDMSPRASAVLCAATTIFCEDTRHSGSLLKKIGASARLVVANDHTEHDACEQLLQCLTNNEIVAVITDAGTPGISDPGERLVRAAVGAGHRINAVPGPAAFVMAAIMSGLSTQRIAFDGFLPRSGAERRERLTEVAHERRTTVLYEAPHRLQRTIADLHEACGPQRVIAITRELTKMHEEIWRGTLAEALQLVETQEPRGEYALVIEPAPIENLEITDAVIVNELTQRVNAGLSKRDAVDEVTIALGISRNRAYEISINLLS